MILRVVNSSYGFTKFISEEGNTVRAIHIISFKNSERDGKLN